MRMDHREVKGGCVLGVCVGVLKDQGEGEGEGEGMSTWL